MIGRPTQRHFRTIALSTSHPSIGHTYIARLAVRTQAYVALRNTYVRCMDGMFFIWHWADKIFIQSGFNRFNTVGRLCVHIWQNDIRNQVCGKRSCAKTEHLFYSTIRVRVTFCGVNFLIELRINYGWQWQLLFLHWPPSRPGKSCKNISMRMATKSTSNNYLRAMLAVSISSGRTFSI